MRARARHHRFELNADVNVVSLIDVMLLLLVIFMITAPMMQGGIDITLPKAETKPLESKDGLTITVNRAGVVSFGDEKYPISQFRTVFRTVSKTRTKNGVYLNADKDVPYGIVAQVLAIMNAAGVSNVGLMTEPEEIH
jgi:biopolymer transport protein ExbD/biopolymer transport protein TolR